MPKLIYLIHSPPHLDRGAFCDRVRYDLAPRLLERNPQALKLGLTDPDLRKPLYLPIRKTGLALISIWTPDEPAPWTALIQTLGYYVAGYRVTESTPLAYDRDWPDGTATPGAALLTLFRKKRGLPREDFIRIWHEGHSPMALKTHPLWNYLRNVVDSPITRDAAPWDAIVEEHFRSEADLTDPRRFFGSTLLMVPRLAHVLAQTNTFLDHKTLESYILSEHWLKS